jgi:hypothetical protein
MKRKIIRLRVEKVTREKIVEIHQLLKTHNAFHADGDFSEAESIYRVLVKRNCTQQLIGAGFPAFELLK